MKTQVPRRKQALKKVAELRNSNFPTVITVMLILTFIWPWILPHKDMYVLDGIISDLAEYTLQIVLFVGMAFFTPYHNIPVKMWNILCSVISIGNLINYYSYDDLKIFMWLFVAAAFYVASQIYYRYNFASSRQTSYNPNKTYICLKRPSAPKSLLLGLFYYPYDAISIIHKGYWYKTNGSFIKVKSKLKHVPDKYHIIEIMPNKHFDYRLEIREGKRFNLINANCHKNVAYVCNGHWTKLIPK